MDEKSYKHYVNIPLDILCDPDLTASAIRVYGAIRSFGNWKDGTNCFPSRSKIAKRACCSIPVVDVQKKILRKKGYLAWGSGKTGRANEYQFPLEGRDRASSTIATPIAGNMLITLPSIAHQESYTENHYREGSLPIIKKNRLLYGEDKCSVLEDGTIKIYVPHLDEWKIYGGGEDHLFIFNGIRGAAAIHAALEKYAPNR